ncbi:MAG TPA: flagellar basal body-associated FliL family protein [Solirubrobacteraceae bacterium]|jgi:flagellar FliL protein|nr:flagellar basal body-associated FliL family protein [Solirubrobacteraceae bacterium]
MNKKILIPILVVIVGVVGFAGYTFAMPKKAGPKVKVSGTIYILPKQFTVNLKGGQYATLTVALLLAPTQSVGVTSASDPPPTGFGSLTEEAVIRAIITNDVTDQPESSLITGKGRAILESKILSDIKSQTDTLVNKIYFTDVAVQ